MTFIIFLLTLLMPLLKKHLSAGCIYPLWIIVLIGFLLPVRFGNNIAFIHIEIPQMYDAEYNVQEKVEFSNKESESLWSDYNDMIRINR